MTYARYRIQDRSTLDDADWKHIRRAVAVRARFRCECCGKYLGMRGHADHIVPRAECEAQGIHPKEMANLQWLCPPCHNRKSSNERWAGHQKVKRKPFSTRRKVTGRNAYHAALLQSMTETRKPNDAEISGNPTGAIQTPRENGQYTKGR